MQRSRIKKSFVRQHDRSDCGVACLASVIQYHDGEVSLETLRKLSGTSTQGTTLLGLLQAAMQLGFDAEGMEAESVANLGELKEPAILHVTIEERLQHYLVYYPKRSDGSKPSDRYQFGDPAKGIIDMSRDELDKIWKSKALLTLKPNEQFQKKEKINKQKQKWIVDLVREDFTLLMISLALGMAIAVLGISTAIFSQKLIDDILPKENIPKLILSLVLVTLLLLVRSGLGFLRGLLMIRQGIDFNNRMIRDFYGNILRLPKSFFDTRKIGELIARMGDTRRIQTVIVALSGSVVIDFLLVLVSFGFVFAYSSTIGMVVLTCVPVYAFVLIKFSKPLFLKQKNVMAGYALTESNFIDTMQGVAEVKLTGTESFFEKQNASVFGKFQQSIANLGRLNIRFALLSEIIGIFFMMAMFGSAAWLVLNKQLLLGEMVALLGMSGNIIPSINRLVAANIQIQEAKVAFDRMFEFTSMEKEDVSEENKSSLENVNLSVELKSVAFRFPGRKQILKNISLTIAPGEMIALLGESGSGKSTTIQLIQKFYTPESGAILINEKDLTNFKIQSWRSMLGCVPQDVKIFNGNLIFNITLSNEEDEHKKAMAFCEETGFGKFFNELPQSYLTLVGEEGVNLSGGQKQLVALARSLYRKPKVLLLDEATSAMDRNTENFIISLLTQLKSEMAILMITHRVQTASKCDRVYILDKGVIVNSGRPKELIGFENPYSESMLELQTIKKFVIT